MSERMPTDECTLDGGVAVSGALLKRVADDASANRTALAEHGVILTAINKYAETGSTAQIQMAAIMAEREKRAAAAEEARLRREEMAADRQDATRDKLMSWLGENWKVLGLGLILILNPASMGKLYELGLLAPFGVPAPAVVVPAVPAAAAPVLAPEPAEAISEQP